MPRRFADWNLRVFFCDRGVGPGLRGVVADGPQPVSEELRRRLGDILVLPRLGHFVWWREPGIMANTFHGHHGGLTPNELITVFGAIDTL